MSTGRVERYGVIVLAIILSNSVTRAHDLWLVPPKNPKAGEKLLVLAHSGEQFPVSEHAPDPTAFLKQEEAGLGAFQAGRVMIETRIHFPRKTL